MELVGQAFDALISLRLAASRHNFGGKLLMVYCLLLISWQHACSLIPSHQGLQLMERLVRRLTQEHGHASTSRRVPNIFSVHHKVPASSAFNPPNHQTKQPSLASRVYLLNQLVKVANTSDMSMNHDTCPFPGCCTARFAI